MVLGRNQQTLSHITTGTDVAFREEKITQFCISTPKDIKKKQQLGAKSQFPCSFLLLLYYFSLFLFATINGYFNRSREKLFLCLHVRVFDLVTQRSVLLWVCCRLTAVFTNSFYQLSHTVFFCMCTHFSPVAFAGKMITRWGTAEFLVKNLNVASTHLNCWM